MIAAKSGEYVEMGARKKIVVLTGAGISAESGLRTFRDGGGWWEGYRIEEVATPAAWKKDPGLVLDFYNFRRREVRQAQPNAAHWALAELEAYHDVDIITQNIDDLHERAGSKKVMHLHGEILKMRSERDEELCCAIEQDIALGDKAPDGGQWRPHIVWFGEAVPLFPAATSLVSQADLFLVVGTSLLVYPAASLIDYVLPSIPTMVIDRVIPNVTLRENTTCIEQPATIGVPAFVQQCMSNA